MSSDHNQTTSDQNKGVLTPAQRRKIRKEQYRQLMVSFVLMLAFTIFAFYAIGSEVIPNAFAVYFILVLATIQVLLQFFIFMHLRERGSGYFIFFIGSGIFIALVMIAALIHVRTL